MLEDKEKLLKKNTLITIRKNKREMSVYEKIRNLYFVLTVLFCLILIGVVYFLSDASDVYRIAVKGNHYLSDERIRELSGLNADSKYLLLLPSRIEKRIRENGLIADAKVRRLDGRLVEITVTEKKILGYAPENGLNVLYLEGGEKIGVGPKEMHLISYGPFIEGFEGELLNTLIRQLGKCDSRMIEQISEIHQYPDLKYQNVELIMRDGNYIFSGVYGIELIGHYFEMRSSYVSMERRCYYFEDISGNAYTSACPWESEPETAEETTETEIEE